MTITEVRVRPFDPRGRIRAVVSVTFDECFVVHEMRVIEGQGGLFVAMPSRRLPGGEYIDVAHPINSATREMIQNAVLEEYEKVREPDGGCML